MIENATAYVQRLPDVLAGIASVLINAQPIGQVSIFTIIIYFAYQAVASVQIRMRLAAEARALQQLAQEMVGQEDGEIPDVERIAAVEALLPPKSLAAQTLRAVWRTRRLPNPDINSILTRIRASVGSGLASLRSAPNALLLLGLFGTVVGLGATIGSLAPQLRDALAVQEPGELTRQLSLTLGEMQTAFAATLWGILAALVMAAVVRGVIRQQSLVQRRALDLVIDVLAPQLLPSSLEAQLDDMRQVLGESRMHMQDVSKIMGESATAFEGVLDRTGATMATNIEQLAAVSASMQQALETLSEDVRKSAGSLVDSMEEMRASTSQLGGFHQDMRNAYVEMNNLYLQAREHTEEHARDQLDKVHELQRQFGTASQEVIVSLTSVGEGLKSNTGSLQSAEQGYREAADRVLVKLSAGFGELDDKLSKTLGDHGVMMGHAEQQLAHIHKTLASLTERLDPALLPRETWTNVELNVVGIRESLERSHADFTALREYVESMPITLPAHDESIGSSSVIDSEVTVQTEQQPVERSPL